MNIYIGADHAGYNLKEHLIPYIKSLGYTVVDCGAFELKKDDDYPVFISKVAKFVSHFPNKRKGIVIGGSGLGEMMMANRFSGVRAALFYGGAIAHGGVDISGRTSADPMEIVKLSRLHNDSNVLSLGARFISEDEAKEAIKIWLETAFENEHRHNRRIRLIEKLSPRGQGLRLFIFFLLLSIIIGMMVK
jgi:ribose 5-phosphate isomerase B